MIAQQVAQHEHRLASGIADDTDPLRVAITGGHGLPDTRVAGHLHLVADILCTGKDNVVQHVVGQAADLAERQIAIERDPFLGRQGAIAQLVNAAVIGLIENRTKAVEQHRARVSVRRRAIGAIGHHLDLLLRQLARSGIDIEDAGDPVGASSGVLFERARLDRSADIDETRVDRVGDQREVFHALALLQAVERFQLQGRARQQTAAGLEKRLTGDGVADGIDLPVASHDLESELQPDCVESHRDNVHRKRQLGLPYVVDGLGDRSGHTVHAGHRGKIRPDVRSRLAAQGDREAGIRSQRLPVRGLGILDIHHGELIGLVGDVPADHDARRTETHLRDRRESASGLGDRHGGDAPADGQRHVRATSIGGGRSNGVRRQCGVSARRGHADGVHSPCQRELCAGACSAGDRDVTRRHHRVGARGPDLVGQYCAGARDSQHLDLRRRAHRRCATNQCDDIANRITRPGVGHAGHVHQSDAGHREHCTRAGCSATQRDGVANRISTAGCRNRCRNCSHRGGGLHAGTATTQDLDTRHRVVTPSCACHRDGIDTPAQTKRGTAAGASPDQRSGRRLLRDRGWR